MDEPKVSPGGGWASRCVAAAARVEDAILVLILAAMIVLAAAQIMLRNVFDTALLWGDPALRVAVLWVGLMGAMVASREDRQISVDVLSRFLPEQWKPRVRVVTDLFTTIVAGFLGWHAGRLVIEERAGGMVAFASIPVWVCELILPVAFAVITIRYAAMTFQHLRQSFGGEPK